jgi:translation initiation factor IF-2
MSEVTVKQLAGVLALPVDKLLEQLAEAGMKFDGPDQVVTSTEKVKLLGFLRRTHGKVDKPVEDAAPKQITLKRRKVEELTVAAGKSKTTVNVEVRQKRTYIKRSEVDVPENPEREEAQRKLAEAQARNQADLAKIDQKDQRVRDEAERKAAEAEAARLAREEEARRAAEPEVVEPVVAAAPEVVPPPVKVREPIRETLREPIVRKPPPAAVVPVPEPEKPAGHGRHGKPAPRHGARENAAEEVGGNRFTKGELHLSEAGSARRGANKKKSKHRPADVSRAGSSQHSFSRPTVPVVREVAIGENITVADLANKLALKGGEVVKALFKMGMMVTINQALDHDTAVLVVEELGHKAVKASDDDAESALVAHVEEIQGDRSPRPPVVTIMGHVDHGKTSLLDYIRRTKVASGEAGGITQHIGAYHVETEKGVISFLDTPGHAAFTAMRARGARLTDIVVLVVAADDGVMPQTIEAIQHARAAKVPLVVAINKVDKSDANPDKVKQELIQHEVVAEDFGGDVMMVPVSAKTGAGIDKLLDALLLQAEVLELSAVFDGRASGVVVESALDKGRGPVATVLVQQGTLKKGDYLVCGVQYGRVRAMFDEAGAQVQEAGPSIPVVVLGLSGVPDAGDDFTVVEDERLAKDVAQQRDAKRRESRLVKQAGNRMEDVMAQMGQGEGKSQQQLNLVIKADVQGSVEALRQALTGLSNDLIRINVLVSGVGGITESDANTAATAKATIIGFNVRADASARRIIETNGVDLRYFSIIYDVIDQVKQVASGLLGVEIREEIIGIAQVREVFRSSKFGAVAGSMVIEGTVKRNKPIRVLRDNTVIFQGELESLRRYKEIVDEVRNGMECGIAVKQYNDVKPGDQIECFERIEVQRTL